MNVLVVDDSVTQRLILKAIVESHSSVDTVFEASEGGKALELVRDNKVDMIFSDINMEPMSGLEFVQNIRSSSINTPVAFITSHLTDSVKEKALSIGGNFFVTKPITEENIAVILEKVLAGETN